MGKTINEFVAEPFTDVFGKTINPGDRVAYVTHGYTVTMGKGWFDGVFKNSTGDVVLTRVRGIADTKSVPTGEIKTRRFTYRSYNFETRSYEDKEYSQEYPEYIQVPCEPYGVALLQRHRMIKIED